MNHSVELRALPYRRRPKFHANLEIEQPRLLRIGGTSTRPYSKLYLGAACAPPLIVIPRYPE
jgi:hypothetical protein